MDIVINKKDASSKIEFTYASGLNLLTKEKILKFRELCKEFAVDAKINSNEDSTLITTQLRIADYTTFNAFKHELDYYLLLDVPTIKIDTSHNEIHFSLSFKDYYFNENSIVSLKTPSKNSYFFPNLNTPYCLVDIVSKDKAYFTIIIDTANKKDFLITFNAKINDSIQDIYAPINLNKNKTVDTLKIDNALNKKEFNFWARVKSETTWVNISTILGGIVALITIISLLKPKKDIF